MPLRAWLVLTLFLAACGDGLNRPAPAEVTGRTRQAVGAPVRVVEVEGRTYDVGSAPEHFTLSGNALFFSTRSPLSIDTLLWRINPGDLQPTLVQELRSPEVTLVSAPFGLGLKLQNTLACSNGTTGGLRGTPPNASVDDLQGFNGGVLYAGVPDGTLASWSLLRTDCASTAGLWLQQRLA